MLSLLALALAALAPGTYELGSSTKTTLVLAGGDLDPASFTPEAVAEFRRMLLRWRQPPNGCVVVRKKRETYAFLTRWEFDERTRLVVPFSAVVDDGDDVVLWETRGGLRGRHRFSDIAGGALGPVLRCTRCGPPDVDLCRRLVRDHLRGPHWHAR